MNKHLRTQGFTIVELLVVIVVIGVLATIVIVAYNGAQGRAADAAAQSDLTNNSKAIAVAQITSSSGQPPLATQAELQDVLKVTKRYYLSQTGGSFAYCRNNDSYALIARSLSGITFAFSTSPAAATATYPIAPNTVQVSSTGYWGGSDVNSACMTRAGIQWDDAGFGALFLLQNGTWLYWVKG